MSLHAVSEPLAGPSPLPCGWLRMDEQGGLIDINDRLRQWLHWRDDAPLPKRFTEVLTPASRLLYETQLIAQLKLHGRLDETYLSLRTSDGSSLPVMLCMTVDDDGRSSPRQTTCIVMRTGERVRLHDDLRRLQRSAEQIPGVVLQYLIAADGSARVPYASDGLVELFGMTPAQVRQSAKGFWHHVHPEDLPLLNAIARRPSGEATPWRGEFRLMQPDGSVRWIEGRARPQWLADGSVLWHAYLGDASESRRLREAAIAGETALRVGQARSEWLAKVSHELRTPLNAVLGFTQVLMADPSLSLGDDHRRKFGHIEVAGRHLLHLIDEVLEFSRVEAGGTHFELRPCRLLPMLDEAVAMTRFVDAAEGIALRVSAAPDLAVLAEPRRLVQCLVNLLSNAVKFNVPGGRVDVEGEAQPHDGHAVIQVRDTGRGLSAPQLAHLFEPFNRLGAERGLVEGSGLGLAITRGLVEGMGGTLAASSEPGAGTLFTIRLPLAPFDNTSPPPALVDEATAVNEHRRSVLYVEDNPVNALLMSAICAMRPQLRLEIAETAAEAVAKAVAAPPELLLIDMGLPDGDGTELLARLQEYPELREVVAVMVSADVTLDTIANARAAGFRAYWTKPLDLRQTLASLDSLLGLPQMESPTPPAPH